MQSPCELSPRFQILFWIALCFSLFAFGVTVYDGYQRLNAPIAVVQSSSDILRRVSRQMVLPEDETPTIATIADLTQLQNSPLFEEAEVGDKIIIYARAGLIVLYSPTYERIVRVAPLYVGAASTTLGQPR